MYSRGLVATNVKVWRRWPFFKAKMTSKKKIVICFHIKPIFEKNLKIIGAYSKTNHNFENTKENPQFSILACKKPPMLVLAFSDLPYYFSWVPVILWGKKLGLSHFWIVPTIFRYFSRENRILVKFLKFVVVS